MMKRLLLTLAVLAGLSAPALASQGSGCIPTTGTMSGLQLVTRLNSAIDALISSNSGASAPVTACSGASLQGQVWLDTSTSPPTWRMYDISSWLAIGVLDSTNHIWTPPVGGGTNSIASAATTTLASVPQAYVAVTGTTGISSLGSATAGIAKFVKFTGVLTLTYNATSLILPTAANVITQAGDQALFVSLGGSNWSALAYTRADGTSLASASAFSSQIAFTGIISPAALSSTTNDWAPAGLAVASTIRASGTIDLNITGLTAQGSGTIILFQNVGTTTLTLVDASASSSAANRFSLGADLPLGPSQGVVFRYDGTLSRWAVQAVYKQQSSSAQAIAGTDNTTLMTPARTAAAIAALATSAGTDYQAFTTNGTWTKPSGTTSSSRVYAECWGPGGGGSSNSTGGGGGGGDHKFGWFLASALGSTEAITIPSGGAVNTTGGNATFGSKLTAYGGGGAVNVSNSAGGGGGGALGAGGQPSGTGSQTGGRGGSPGGGTAPTPSGGNCTAAPQNDGYGGGAGGSGCDSGQGGSSAEGGGGGGPGFGINTASGSAIWGGGGGQGADHDQSAGTSDFGGNGGADGSPGSAPAGGGGRNAAGGRGECRITTFK